MSGFVKTTTLEWEGVVSSLILLSKDGGDFDDAIDYLAERKGVVEGVILDPLEGTTPEEVIALLKQIRAMGYRIRLTTDGSSPDVIDDLIGANYVDSVMVRLDSGIDAPVMDTISIVTEYGLECEYRTVLDRDKVTKDDIARYAKAIKGAKRYILVQSKKSPFKSKDALEAAEAAKGYVKNVMIRQ